MNRANDNLSIIDLNTGRYLYVNEMTCRSADDKDSGGEPKPEDKVEKFSLNLLKLLYIFFNRNEGEILCNIFMVS